MKRFQSLLYLLLATGMLLFAVPQLQVGHGFRAETVFAIVWLGLALTVIASHLYVLLKVEQTPGPGAEKLKQMTSS
jgi:hypothetical protein